MFGVYLLNFIIMHILLFKLAILPRNCHIDDFTIGLWHLNKVHQNVQCCPKKMSHLNLQLHYDKVVHAILKCLMGQG
jgi:hypothetical protein